ncbi:MAG: acetyl-CoA acetyltransferase, partial [Mycobacterium sp.]|nr:acetyl-CoA acetyltransferase [Mycobacterium sp.]
MRVNERKPYLYRTWSQACPKKPSIYEAIRTPRGKQRNGALNEVKPVNLVVGLIDELRVRFPDLDE